MSDPINMPSPREIQITLDRYGHGEHTYILAEESDHCVNCGATPIWREYGSEDYYVGPSYHCPACQHSFTYQGPDSPDIRGRGEIRFMDELVHAVAKGDPQ